MPAKIITVVAFSLLCSAPVVQGQIIKTLNPIGAGISSTAQAINTSGLVVGYTTTSASLDLPTLWRADAGGTYTPSALPLPAGFVSGGANAINPSGLIAGYVQPAGGATASAITWSPTGPGGAYVASLLPAPAGMNYNAAYGINASGAVAGFGAASTGGSVAMAWTPAATPLPTVTAINPNLEILAGGINDAGDIVGYGVGTGLPITSYVWHPNGVGGYTRQTVIAVETAAVTAINNNGIGAGVYFGDQAMVMAFFEGDYYAIDLPIPNFSSDSASIALNNLDGLVGYVKDPTSTAAGDDAAFWRPTDSFWDYVNLDQWLNTAVGSTLARQWHISEATGINDSWLVVGNGRLASSGSNGDTSGNFRGFVLDISTVAPEPASLSALAAFAALSAVPRCRRRRI